MYVYVHINAWVDLTIPKRLQKTEWFADPNAEKLEDLLLMYLKFWQLILQAPIQVQFTLISKFQAAESN